MTESHVSRAVRLARIACASDEYFRLCVCPVCGISSMIARKTGGYCYNCNKYIDIDEVMDHDRS